MDLKEMTRLRLELSVRAKNGIDFILAASLVWMAITYVWTLPYPSYNKSIITFMIGGVMMPLAILFSKLLKTEWTIKTNPLQPLGLWLNFAQLFYFPFLIFVLIKMPDHFVMVYVIITGAHFFPYAWFFKSVAYAIAAGVISVGAMLLGLFLTQENYFLIPLFLSASLLILAALLFMNYKGRTKSLAL
ncbi:MAG: DUF7010 family protein [Cyclobacteriaceae bacterium]|jgi:hypothetical protein|nr:hypothetical protein [Flammeovirgaceae bacterium]